MASNDTRGGWLARLLPYVGVTLLRFLAATWRWRFDGEERLAELRASGRPILIAAFHGRLIEVTPVPGELGFVPTVMVSASRDGDLAAKIAILLGIKVVRGSSSRGGARALLQLVRTLRDGAIGGHLVDGPRGPREEVKAGLVVAAQRSGAVILPIHAEAQPCWEAGSWDRMQVPLPFARVLVGFGEPIEVPGELDADALEAIRLRVERQMQGDRARLAAAVRGEPTPLRDAGFDVSSAPPR